jgi:hypothetical protein
MIRSWSHSRVGDFEKCKHLAFLKYVKRIPEPERPLPPGRTEHANDRGTRVHNDAEAYVRGTLAHYPHEAKAFGHEMESLRKLYQAGMVSLEGEWGFNEEWEPVAWRGEWVEIDPDPAAKKLKALPEYGRDDEIVKVGTATYMWVPTWLRLKLDALVFLNEFEAVAIDYKTGKKFGNEIKHGEQLMLYQLATFLKYPQLEVVHTELWYLDHDLLTSVTYERERGLKFKYKWNMRGQAMTSCTKFPPNPNKYACQYCPYGAPENGFPNGTGDCLAGRRQ